MGPICGVVVVEDAVESTGVEVEAVAALAVTNTCVLKFAGSCGFKSFQDLGRAETTAPGWAWTRPLLVEAEGTDGEGTGAGTGVVAPSALEPVRYRRLL